MVNRAFTRLPTIEENGTEDIQEGFRRLGFRVSPRAIASMCRSFTKEKIMLDVMEVIQNSQIRGEESLCSKGTWLEVRGLPYAQVVGDQCQHGDQCRLSSRDIEFRKLASFREVERFLDQGYDFTNCTIETQLTWILLFLIIPLGN